MKQTAERARSLDTLEIEKELRESEEQMFRLRFQLRMGQTDGLKKLRNLRRERARMLTVLRERELNPDKAAPVPVKKKAAKKAEAKKTEAKKAEAKKAAPKAKAPKQAAAPRKPAPKKTAKAPRKTVSKG